MTDKTDPHAPYQIKDQSLFITDYPTEFSASRMNEIAELLKAINIEKKYITLVPNRSHELINNKDLKRLSEEIFKAMNRTTIKLSKCDSSEDVCESLAILLCEIIENNPDGIELNVVKTSFERSYVKLYDQSDR